MNDIIINMMIGLQGSGKSTYVVSQLPNAYIFSADILRTRYPEEDNEKIFKRFYQSLEEHIMEINSDNTLLPNLPIYLDNTNTTIKARRATFECLQRIEKKLPGIHFEVNALIMNTPYMVCRARVEKRNSYTTDRYVPVEVVDRYYRNFQIPFKEEGFDNIELIDYENFNSIKNCLFDKVAWEDYKAQFLDDFDQQNAYHNLTLGKHMDMCYKFMLEYNDEIKSRIFDLDRLSLFEASRIHDFGKFFTKTGPDEFGNCHYYNHAEVGTYELMTSFIRFVGSFNDDIRHILRTLAYVNYHMKSFDWKTESTITKEKRIFGDVLVENLLWFNEVDKRRVYNDKENISINCSNTRRQLV